MILSLARGGDVNKILFNTAAVDAWSAESDGGDEAP